MRWCERHPRPFLSLRCASAVKMTPADRRTSSIVQSASSILILGGLLLFQATPLSGSELRKTAIVTAVQAARASVVNIRGEKTVHSEGAGQAIEADRRVNGMGTGVVIDRRGYIITNHHVVDGVHEIQVTLDSGAQYTAQLISFDSSTDLAVIKIDIARALPVITVGTSSDLMPGETVIAVGNAYGYEHTVTRGILSALKRTVQVGEGQQYDDLLQTDASINPGNSGGPLLNIDGEMIGINVAVRAGAQGIGFAIPVDKAMRVAAELMSTRQINKTWHGVVGVEDYLPSHEGLAIKVCEQDSPANQASLKKGDVILSVDGEAITRQLDFELALLAAESGEEVKLSVRRGNERIEVPMVMRSVPKDQAEGDDPVWNTLGMELTTITSNDFRQYRSGYRGGLSVTAVRPNSPASRQGIRRGDVLVGMHVWETVTLDNVSWVLNRPDFGQLDPLKFYILRGRETLYGHMTVSLSNERGQVSASR